jgi:hypothetical protein
MKVSVITTIFTSSVRKTNSMNFRRKLRSKVIDWTHCVYVGILWPIMQTKGAQILLKVTGVTKFCMVGHNVCRSSIWNLLQVTITARRILRWHLDLLKICALLM